LVHNKIIYNKKDQLNNYIVLKKIYKNCSYINKKKK